MDDDDDDDDDGDDDDDDDNCNHRHQSPRERLIPLSLRFIPSGRCTLLSVLLDFPFG